MRNLVAPPAEFAPELRDQRRRLGFVRPLEGASGDSGNDPGYCAHGEKNRQREHQQKFAPKAQGFSISSQTFCNCHSPFRPAVQSLTPAASATGFRRYSNGITRRDCIKACSASVKTLW